VVVRGGAPGHPLAVTDPVAAAYSAAGGAWQSGPGRVYDRLAEVVVARAPVRGCRLVDVGAGTGAATRAALAAGAAHVVAIDAAVGMLFHDSARRPPAAAADALALPFASRSFDVAVAAFSLNHLQDPAAGLREMVRVTRPGGTVLASAYAVDDGHPVKAAVEAAVTDRGWEPEPWYTAVKEGPSSLLATEQGFAAIAAAADLDGEVEHLRVPCPGLDGRALVAWRLGMAQLAPFVAQLSAGEREAVATDALDRLGPSPPELVRSIVVLRAVRS
jgi:SAM-dependent methyltransferase